MAGHSKWANIKHRKAAQDAKRGKIFTKLIREIVVAAREGGAVPEDNPRLRAVMDKALAANMKRDTIDKAIARGTGAGDGDNYEEITYEGYGVGGVAVATVLAELSGAALGLWLCRDAFAHPAALDRRRIMDRARLIAMMVVNTDILARSLLLMAMFNSFLFLGSRFGDVTVAANAVMRLPLGEYQTACGGAGRGR